MRDTVGPVDGVAQPDLDEGEPKPQKLVESITERPVPVGIGVARDPHRHAFDLHTPSPGPEPTPTQDPRQEGRNVTKKRIEDPEDPRLEPIDHSQDGIHAAHRKCAGTFPLAEIGAQARRSRSPANDRAVSYCFRSTRLSWPLSEAL